jgi:RNA polymerase sigma factor (TIGR02999 family)
MPEITRLLDEASAGRPQAATELLALVYEELRLLAAARMAHEAVGHTLSPTALVHEAYLRLIGPAGELPFTNRAHFFAAAAEAMRRILIDHARRTRAAKRGGDRGTAPLDPDQLPARADADPLVVDDALTQLASRDPRAAQLVRLRYFAGLTLAEAAAVLDIPPRSADRLWSYARAWLHEALSAGASD